MDFTRAAGVVCPGDCALATTSRGPCGGRLVVGARSEIIRMLRVDLHQLSPEQSGSPCGPDGGPAKGRSGRRTDYLPGAYLFQVQLLLQGL